MTTITALLLVALAQTPSPAQTPAPQAPTTASAEVMQCAQAQMVVDRLLASADERIELARQNNSAADMRAAVDALQATLRDVRAQLAPCANVQPAPDPHIGHGAAGSRPPSSSGATSMTPASPAAADPHAEHTKTPSQTAPATPTPPAAPASPSAADPHAGHATAPSKPAAKPVTPAAADPHAGHSPAPPKPATQPPAAKPPASKPPAADPHAGHSPGRETERESEMSPQAVDPVCGLKVDPASAPSATHNGRTHHFCSEQHQQLFQKNPAKYLPNME